MSENEMLEEIKSLSPSEEAILTMLIRYQNLKAELEKEKETSHYIQSQLDIANAKLVEEKEENKDLKEGYKIQEHNYQVAMEEIEQRWKDKIKAKIEEVKDGTYDAKIVLQSLLEKE